MKRRRERYVKEREAKIKMRGKVPSSTPGKEKGQSCQKHPLMIRYAKDPRFDRTDSKGYASACRIALTRNKLK